jgi:hypothetical protein
MMDTPRAGNGSSPKLEQTSGARLLAGNSPFKLGLLSAHLTRSARWHSDVALKQSRSTDVDGLLQAAISVGTASELLAKAALATLGAPMLLGERPDEDSLLLASGNGHLSSKTMISFKSISSATAHSMVKSIFKVPASIIADPRNLATQNVRNAAAHMALVDIHELRIALTLHLRLCDALLPVLMVSREEFWGDENLPHVDLMLDEAASELSREVASRIAAATAAFAKILSLPSEQRAVLIELLGQRRGAEAEHIELQECPACHQEGELYCTVERGAVESETDGHDYFVWVNRTALPTEFHCKYCGLTLAEDEIQVPLAGMPSELELEPDSDPEEIRDWEADADDWNDL